MDWAIRPERLVAPQPVMPSPEGNARGALGRKQGRDGNKDAPEWHGI
jgi:hypothetical protein